MWNGDNQFGPDFELRKQQAEEQLRQMKERYHNGGYRRPPDTLRQQAPKQPATGNGGSSPVAAPAGTARKTATGASSQGTPLHTVSHSTEPSGPRQAAGLPHAAEAPRATGAPDRPGGTQAAPAHMPQGYRSSGMAINLDSILSFLNLDNEQIMLLLLGFFLMQEGASRKLILAIFYILL